MQPCRLIRFAAFVQVACWLSGCFGGLDLRRAEKAASKLGLRQGEELATWQDSLLARHARGEPIPEAESRALRRNPWVDAAKSVAPGNLVLRQWVLMDLVSGRPRNADRIQEMALLLAPGSDSGRLWLEGYGYWTYTRLALEPWALRFAGRAEAVRVLALMNAVDSCFAVTAYAREESLYPAPFGDVRDDPLAEPALGMAKARASQEPASCALARVEAFGDTVTYDFSTHPVGLNTHVPVAPSRVVVRRGEPDGFLFYEGYDRKYADSTAELRDMLHPERVRSIETLKLRERFGP